MRDDNLLYNQTGIRQLIVGSIGLLAVIGLLFWVSSAIAGVGLGVAPNLPSTVTLGATNVAGDLDITNNSSGGDGNPVNLTSITLIPSCGANTGTACTSPDTGVFNVDSPATGANACAGKTFTVAVTDATTGKVTFTPNATVTLAVGAVCEINFTFDVVGVPDIDASGSAGMQTIQVAEAAAVEVGQEGLTGGGFGTDTTTVQSANIIVDKVSTPTTETDFEFDPSWGDNFFLDDTDAPHDSGPLAPGSYSVAEVNIPTGWFAGVVHCVSSIGDTEAAGTLELDAGETITCTFNNSQGGRIIVVKQTDPDASTQSFEFDTDYGTNFFLTDGQQNDSGVLEAGTYSVAEVNMPADWTQTSGTCDDQSSPGSITLGANETVTCTFTNTEEVSLEWCSPGYWKNHLDAWEDTGIATTELYSAYFDPVVRSKKGIKDNAPTDPTLLQVVSNPQWYGGEAANNVGDLLSDAHPDVDFTLGDARTPDSCPLN